MKFIKGLLYSILVLLSLISLFIIICAFQPALSAKVASFFQNKLGNSSPYGEETAQEEADSFMNPPVDAETEEAPLHEGLYLVEQGA